MTNRSRPAAGARCAATRVAYWPFQDWVFANQTGENEGAFAATRLASIASAAGLDVETWQACIATGEAQTAVRCRDRRGGRGRRQRDADDAPQRPDDRRPAQRRPTSAHSSTRLRPRRPASGSSVPITAGTRGRFGAGDDRLRTGRPRDRDLSPGGPVLGEAPACGPVKGCETVAASEYATMSASRSPCSASCSRSSSWRACLVWWRRADRRALYAAYGLGLAGIIAVALPDLPRDLRHRGDLRLVCRTR